MSARPSLRRAMTAAALVAATSLAVTATPASAAKKPAPAKPVPTATATPVATATATVTPVPTPDPNVLAPVAECSLYASPTGDDLNAGTAAAPFRSAQKLATTIAPGQTGCLAAGTYAGGMAFRSGGGTATARKIVQSYPGQRATIVGQVYIPDAAAFVTVRNLRLDGTNAEGKPSPMVNGDDSVFTGNNVSSDVDSCFVLGDPVWGVPERTRIEGNHIHHCGVPNTNMDHGVYIRHAIGTQVLGNVIRENPDRGVQLFMNGDDSVVRGNVIDANGEGITFSGDQYHASDRNLVEGNLITNADLRYDVEYWWSANGMIGVGNVLAGNCIHGGVRGTIMTPVVGFEVLTNSFLDPLYDVRNGATYTLKALSPCTVTPPVLAATAL